MTSLPAPRDTIANRLMTLGLVLILLLVLGAALGPMLAWRDPAFIRLDERLLPPLSSDHLLGTDQLGRDVAARLLAGLRWSMATAGLATLISAVLGTVLGLVAAHGRWPFAGAIRQVTALAQAFPVFVLAVSIIAIVGNGFWAVVLTLGLVTWPVFCRVVEAEVSSLRKREYVLAAGLMQMSQVRLYAWHILPGLVPSLAVLIAFHFADMLIAESALAFLGIGAPLGAATWGAMLSESRAYLLTAPWLLLVPASAVVLVVIAFNLVGDGLRRRFG
jgi:peptide/nickel transport system permease protein